MINNTITTASNLSNIGFTMSDKLQPNHLFMAENYIKEPIFTIQSNGNVIIKGFVWSYNEIILLLLFTTILIWLGYLTYKFGGMR
jgi:hypothetical protein